MFLKILRRQPPGLPHPGCGPIHRSYISYTQELKGRDGILPELLKTLNGKAVRLMRECEVAWCSGRTLNNRQTAEGSFPYTRSGVRKICINQGYHAVFKVLKKN